MGKIRKIQFDGCAFPNPGEMGIGIVLLEDDSTIISISKKLPDKGTNNIAEYTALLTGIRKALELNWKEVIIEGDSRLVVNQVNGNWSIKKEHLENIYNQVLKDLSKFDSYSLKWVPRNNNSTADKLATKALGYDEDPSKTKKFFKSPQKTDKIMGIKCPKCEQTCQFEWQIFKNGSRHIRQECPIHGYIRYAPNREPFITMAK